jgi:putative transposase
LRKKKFHEKEGLSLSEAFKKMLRTFFVANYEDGEPILLPRSERPEYKTFVYHVNKEKQASPAESIIARIGERQYNLNWRPKIGSSTKAAFAPGSNFHIDATIADVYLVSSYRDNLPIGRPVIYSVIDVFSHFITGLYIGFEGPSYLGAAMAIYNTGISKVEYCRRVGMTITEDQWPSFYLPQQFTADRGEMLTKKNEGIRHGLDVDIEYAAPYRADWKPLVERIRIRKKIRPNLMCHNKKCNNFRSRWAK